MTTTSATTRSTVPKATLQRIHDRSGAMSERIVEQIIELDRAYAASSLAVSELRAVVRDNVTALLHELGGGPGSLEPARRAGRMKAEAGIPVASLLHAYRLAGLEVLRTVADEAARSGETAIVLDTVESLWTVLDRYSTAASDAYRDVIERRRRRHDETRHIALLALLERIDSETNLALLGFQPTGVFVVVAARNAATVPGADPIPAEILRRQGATACWTSSPSERVGLVHVHAPQGIEELFDDPESDGGTALGVSMPFERPEAAAKAARQARLALLSLGAGTGVRRYESRPVDVLLVTAPAAAAEVRERVLGEVLRLPDDDAEKLLTTFEAWIEFDGSTARAADALHCHRNSVLYRLQRLEALSGRRVRSPLEVCELVAAVRAHRLVG